MNFSERLKKIRTSKRYTQKEFSKMIGCGFSSLCNYEAGRQQVTQKIISNICRLFPEYTVWLITEINQPLQQINPYNQPTPTTASKNLIENNSINIKSTNTGNIHLDDKNSTQNNSTLRQKIIATPKNKTAYFEFLKKEFNTVYLKDLKEEELIYVLDYLESCL